MQIVCPNCNARYLAPDAQIGPNGRKVRCARCANVWRVDPPPPTPQTDPDSEAAAPAAAPPGETVTPDRTVRIDPLPRNRMPAPAEPPRRRSRAPGWILLIGVVAALAAGFYYGRDELLRLWPASASLYEAAGLYDGSGEIAPKPARLQVGNLENAWIETDGRLELVLKGAVKNESDEAAPAPFVRIRLFNRQGEIVRDKREILDGGDVAPGETRTFAMRFNDPGDVARALPVLEPVR